MRKSKQSKYVLVGLTVPFAMVAAACGGGGAEATRNGGGGGEPYTLKIADSFPEGHIASEQVVKPFMENVEERSEGRIQFDYYPAEQLGAAADLLDLTKGGVTDIGYIAPLYYSDQLPLSSIGGLPGMYEDALSGVQAFQQMVTEGALYEAEIEQQSVNPLFSICTGEYQIATSEKPVTSKADVRGLRLRTSGGYQELTVKELGGTGVSLAAPEMYQAIQQGTVDGTLISAESIPPYSLDELVTELTSNLALGGFCAFYGMETSRWESLPEDLQQILIDEGNKVTETGGQAFVEQKERLLSEFSEAGISVNELSASAVQGIGEVSETVQQAWANDMEDRGLPGNEALQEFRDLAE